MTEWGVTHLLTGICRRRPVVFTDTPLTLGLLADSSRLAAVTRLHVGDKDLHWGVLVVVSRLKTGSEQSPFRHTGLSVTLDYPSHWTIRHTGPSVTLDHPSHWTIRHRVNPSKLTLSVLAAIFLLETERTGSGGWECCDESN